MANKPNQLLPLFGQLRRFIGESQTAENAALRLGISKGTLSKWLAKGRLTDRGLRRLAGSNEDRQLAEAAQETLRVLKRPFSTFNFSHAAAQLMTPGAEPALMGAIQDNATEDDLEYMTIYSLVSVYAESRYRQALSQAAVNEFHEEPVHALGRRYTSDYENPVWGIELKPSSGSLDAATIDNAISEMRKLRDRRNAITNHLVSMAKDKPSHLLSQEIDELTQPSLTEPIHVSRDFDREQCQKVAAFATVDVYGYQSAAMEAADTFRRAANHDPTIERHPLYLVAARLYEMCYLERHVVINNLQYFLETFEHDAEASGKMHHIIQFINGALYTSKGVAVFAPGFTVASLNGHGSVVGTKRGNIRTTVGKKRKAPKAVQGDLGNLLK